VSRFYKTTLAVAMLMACATAHAEGYQVTVTRQAFGVYKVDGKNVLIHTRHCHEHALSANAILRAAAFDGSIFFTDSREKCEVQAVYGPANTAAGKYTVAVSRQEDGWYQVSGTETFIKTAFCLNSGLGEEAVLALTASGNGQLVFKGRDSCVVEGLYSRVQL